MDRGKKIIKRLFEGALILLMIMFFSSCEKYRVIMPEVDPDATWSLQNDIQPIFNDNCTKCHGGAYDPDLRTGKSFQKLTDGEFVNTADPESSTLYIIIEGSVHLARTPDMTENDRLKILYWITQGALNN